jgi:hypothetical protein
MTKLMDSKQIFMVVAIVATLSAAVVVTPALAQNMTGGNMTGGNMTGGNTTAATAADAAAGGEEGGDEGGDEEEREGGGN